MGNIVHPGDLEACRVAYKSAYDARRDFQFEYRTNPANGDVRWVLASGVPRFGLDGSFEGYVGTITDITDLKRSRDEEVGRQKLELWEGWLAGSPTTSTTSWAAC